MTDVPGFDPLQEVSLIEADFSTVEEAYDYLEAQLGLPEEFQRTPESLRECMLDTKGQAFVMITRCEPHRDWFTPLCEALEAASCENTMLVVMYSFTIV